ncbi:MAG: hypothetical protein IKN71_08255 [Alphaproteobacteria bacterium]|nr:hypothetical protein [Alphaproteobacteria bacterium]
MQYFKNLFKKVKNTWVEIVDLVVLLRRAQSAVFAYLEKEPLYQLLKKAFKSTVVSICLIALLWGLLYHLTDWSTLCGYFWTGVAVCCANILLSGLLKRRFDKIIYLSANWVIMAGLVLVLYHAGFASAAVFVAAVFLASPFLGASLYEGVVGFTLLVTLARLTP